MSNTLLSSTAKTGIPGLDDVLGGGMPRNRLYLVQGDPGVGKTTLALQFLIEGVQQGERVLYITLSETQQELEGVSASHGWSLEGIDLFELSAVEELLKEESQQSVFHPAEIELNETTKSLLEVVDRINPKRVVFDSLSELRLLARDALRYRRQILSLKQYFAGKKCTVMLLDDNTADVNDLQLQSIAHGVISLEQKPSDYGIDRRRLRIQKLRGVHFRSGYHDMLIEKGGIQVFPRLIAAEHRGSFLSDTVSSNIPALDNLLGGGLDGGVSALLLGPAGVGKSSVAVQFAVAAASRGDCAALYSFEESPRTLYKRAKVLGQNIAELIDKGTVMFQQVDPAELTPGEFSHIVRRAVEENNVKIVVIDSLNGYLNAMPDERFLVLQLHELLTFLGQKGVTTILVVAQHGMIGTAPNSPVDVSYLADTVVFFRFFEHRGEVRQAISVLKRRGGVHERSIRELSMSSEHGIEIGEPLHRFRGILTGTPVVEQPGEVELEP